MRARALALAIALAAPATATGQGIAEARYAEPTDRYAHAVLGDAIEHGALVVRLTDGSRQTARLDAALVFEDTAPRLHDLDGDGDWEVVAVESHQSGGARLAVWGLADGRLTRLAATPHIGTRYRWLAPLGAADLDGDGAMEIAYIDRPHLARVLRVWRYDAPRRALSEVAAAEGHTNHRIGERTIAGGIRDCGAGPEVVTASGDWTRLLATRLEGGRLVSRDIGAHAGRDSFTAALACR
jgi:hypothetical protein